MSESMCCLALLQIDMAIIEVRKIEIGGIGNVREGDCRKLKMKQGVNSSAGEGGKGRRKEVGSKGEWRLQAARTPYLAPF